MNVPSKCCQIHDEYHLGKRDFDLSRRDTIYRVDEVTAISTPVVPKYVCTQDPLVKQMAHSETVFSIVRLTWQRTYVKATQGIFGPLRVITMTYTPKVLNKRCSTPVHNPKRGTRKKVETRIEKRCARLGREGGILTKRDARGYESSKDVIVYYKLQKVFGD